MSYSDFITDESQFYILDLSQNPQSGTKGGLRGWESSVAAILTDIRQPLTTPSIRVVLWSVGKFDSLLEGDLAHALNIEAQFFLAAHEKKACSSDGEPERDSSRRLVSPYAPLVPSYAEIGKYLIRIVTDHEIDDNSSVSVVVIAGSDWQTDWVAKQFRGELPSQDTNTSHGDPQESLRWDNTFSDYVLLLHWSLARGNRLTGIITRTSLIFGALLPLVYISTFPIKDRSSRIRLAYIELLDDKFGDSAQKDRAIFDLYSQRLGLRREVENSEDDSEQLARYIILQGLTELEKDFPTVQELYNSVHKSALRLDAEVRDYLDLQSGRMALQESQKSILLSNLQIEEYKRGSSLPGTFEIFESNEI